MSKHKASFSGVTAIAQTDAALCVVVDGKKVWIPLSQIDDDSEVYENGHSGELVVSQWIAEQKGLV